MNDTKQAFQWLLHPDVYKLVRFARDSEEVQPAVALELFVSVTYSPDDITAICLESDDFPGAILISDNWRVLQVKGPYEEQNSKQIEMIVRVLRKAGIEVFFSSAFDTDYMLIKHNQIAQALDALEAAEQSIDQRSKTDA